LREGGQFLGFGLLDKLLNLLAEEKGYLINNILEGQGINSLPFSASDPRFYLKPCYILFINFTPHPLNRYYCLNKAAFS
jgi:hypothetical protein